MEYSEDGDKSLHLPNIFQKQMKDAETGEPIFVSKKTWQWKPDPLADIILGDTSTVTSEAGNFQVSHDTVDSLLRRSDFSNNIALNYTNKVENTSVNIDLSLNIPKHRTHSFGNPNSSSNNEGRK